MVTGIGTVVQQQLTAAGSIMTGTVSTTEPVKRASDNRRVSVCYIIFL